MKFKEELEKCNEMLNNLCMEMNEVREKAADEIKAAQDSHEEELARYREQYIQQEKQMKIDFNVEKMNLENTIAKLKEDIEVINNEKTILMAVTVKEYEDQLQSLKDALNGAKMESKALEETHNMNINMYENKLEEQEKHYISTLERIQSEVLSNASASVSTSNSNLRQKQQRLHGFTDASCVIKQQSNSKKQMISINDKQTLSSNRSLNVPKNALMPNSICTHQKQCGQLPGARNSPNAFSLGKISTTCRQGKAVTLNDCQSSHQEQLYAAGDNSRLLLPSCTHSKLPEQQHVTSLSEFAEENVGQNQLPCNKSYYKRLNLPSPKPIKTISRQACGEQFVCEISSIDNDNNCNETIKFSSNDSFPGKTFHKIPKKCNITHCNCGSNKNTDSDQKGCKPVKGNDYEAPNYFVQQGRITKKRKLCDPRSYIL